ncbi:MAG: hypothetical protein M1828_003155 [Chrysothrix sp. TS-e1954]|nr:MAG: hypothetical protein M1828_003155 [Chrysothrix sp. TS-e1954]
MAPAQNTSSETSPLLAKPFEETVDSSATVASEPPSRDAKTSNDGHDADGNALERQTTDEGRKKQFEGMPDVKSKMPYIFPALAIGVFLAAADQTIIVSSYGTIGSDLGALNKTSWIGTAYFLTLTSFQPLYGKLSDIFSRTSCLLTAYLIFGLGCLFCGLAQDMNQLIAARAFAGIGGGGMTTVVSILLSDVIPLKERGTWQGYINIIYASGAGAGAPMGGVFADGPGWRWSFLFQPPLCLIAFIAVGLVLKMPPKEHQTKQNWRAKFRRVDFLGALTLVLAVFCLVFAFDRGSNLAWSDKYTLIAICVAVPLFGLFLFVEMKVAAEPFAPGHIILERSLFASYLCNFFAFSGWMAVIFYVPLYFQAVNGYSAAKSGLLLLPGIAGGVSGSLFGGYYMRRTGKYYWLTVIAYANLVVGSSVVLLFSGLLVRNDIGIVIGLTICGLSNGIGVTSSLIALISNAAREDQAIATACSYLFRALGSTTGLSLSSTVANQTLRAQLRARLSGSDATTIEKGVRQSLKYIQTLKPELRTAVRQAYSVSTRGAIAVDVGLVAGAALAAWFIREKPLSGGH